MAVLGDLTTRGGKDTAVTVLALVWGTWSMTLPPCSPSPTPLSWGSAVGNPADAATRPGLGW